MKKIASFVITSICCLLSVRLASAGNLQSRIFSSNHAYSTAAQVQRSDLTIALKPSTAVPDSKIEVFIYAIAPTATASDGLADANAFDIGNISVECPRSIPGAFEFGAPQIIPADRSHIYYKDGFYHKIVCPYTGDGRLEADDFGYSNDNFMRIKNIINPKNDPTLPNTQLIRTPIWLNFHTTATAQMTITSARSVKMLATIEPQISIWIDGLPKGGRYCDQVTTGSSTGKLADFGKVSNTYFSDVAQKLSATANIAHGYVVTVIQDDQMRLLDDNREVVCKGNGYTDDACIPNLKIDGLTSTTMRLWENKDDIWINDEPRRGLGYTMENVYGKDNLFDWHQGYTIFADKENEEDPVPIMTSKEGRYGVNYICYRVVPTDENIVGNYANNITYTLTAHF